MAAACKLLYNVLAFMLEYPSTAVNYDRKLLIKLAAGPNVIKLFTAVKRAYPGKALFMSSTLG